MAEPWPVTSATLVVTAACNLRCTYCYQTAKRPERMSWRTARTSVDRLLAGGSRSPGLALTGGEPLLAYPIVRRLIARVRATGPAGRAARITVLTNGTRLGEAQVRFLAAHGVNVRISIDGAAPAQHSRGAWTSPRLDRLLDDLRRRHRSWFTRRVSVASTLTPEHVPHLADSVEYLLRKGVRSIEVAPALGAAPGWHDGLRAVLDAQVARLFDTSLGIYAATGQVPIKLFHHGASYARTQAMCGVSAGTKIAVDADGEVYGCTPGVASFLRDPLPLLSLASAAMHLGHISDPGLASTLPAYAEALRATGLFGPRNHLHSSYGSCRRCRHVHACTVCPFAIASAPGAHDPTRVPDFVCAFNKAALKYRARFPRRFVENPVQPPQRTSLHQHGRNCHEHAERLHAS